MFDKYLNNNVPVVVKQSVNETITEIKSSSEMRYFIIVMGVIFGIAFFVFLALSTYKEELISSDPYPFMVGATYKVSENSYVNVTSESNTTVAIFLGSCEFKPNMTGKTITVTKEKYYYNSIFDEGVNERLTGIKQQVCKS